MAGSKPKSDGAPVADSTPDTSADTAPPTSPVAAPDAPAVTAPDTAAVPTPEGTPVATPVPTADTGVSSDIQRAAEKRLAAAVAPDTKAGMVAALLDERRGYVTRKMTDRVAQVDEQIRFYGGTPPTE